MQPDLDDTQLTPVRLPRRDVSVLEEATEPSAAIRAEREALGIPGAPERSPSRPERVAAAPPSSRPGSTAALRVRIGRDDLVELDRPALVGRRPSRPRIPTGPPETLVRVPSSEERVSSTHLELRQVGSTVLLTDLRSTNGTTVLVPGRPPRLVQGESLVIGAGTVIRIGDGTELEVLAPVSASPVDDGRDG